MDDVLRRLSVIENDVSATKAGIGALVTQVGSIAAELPHLASKADVSDAKVSIIQWMVGTTIAVAGLAFAVAKFVH